MFSGGLGSYTPSKIQMDGGDAKFQLGVSRAVPNSTPVSKAESVTTTVHKTSSNNTNNKESNKTTYTEQDSNILRPTEDAISWSGSSSSSDILF